MSPVVCCVIVLNDKKEILFIKRGKEPYKNNWALISGIGYAKMGPTIEDGAKEEVVGDVGVYPTEVEKLFDIKSGDQDVQVFLARVNVESFKPQAPNTVDWTWRSLDKVEELGDLAFNHREILERLSSTGIL